MNIISKISFVLISICLISFLLFVTYSSSENTYYKNNEIWLFELKNNEIWLFELKNNEINKVSSSGSETIFIKKITSTDRIFFSNWNVKIENNNWFINIYITPWFYIFDFKKINSNYKIIWDWFNINNKWPGLFIVNNLDKEKNIIFSLNWLIDLTLKNIKTNENLTSIDLYPHNYLIFNPLKNIFIKNADLLKISQTSILWYFEKQIAITEDIPKDFIDLVSLQDLDYEKIIKKVILYIKNENIKNTEIYDKMIKSSLSKLPGEDLILKYLKMFINPSKKNIFYKNAIIRNINSLLLNKDIDPETINKIIDNAKILEENDEKWLNEVKNIILYYNYVVLNSNSNINTKINLFSLLSILNKENFSLDFKSLISLRKTFFEYDFIWNKSFYKEISSFRKEYFKDLDTNLKWESINRYSIEQMEKTDYFLFFIENILISADFNSSNIDTKDLIVIFNDYVNISNSFYVSNDEKIKRTWLFKYSILLNNFINILQNRYFSENRNNNLLLELKENIKIIDEDIILLEKNINEIIDFFEKNKTVLKTEINTKDRILAQQYLIIEEKFKEYFSALKNYKEYIIKYDKNKNDLLKSSTINEKEDNIVLSEKIAKEYLNKFNWVSLKLSTIKIMDYNYCVYPTKENEFLNVEIPYCYKIEDLNIIWDNYIKNISFILHPFEKNKINEIYDDMYADNEKKYWSYKLDEVKIILDEKFKVATKDKDRYDFNNFLINTFWKNIDIETDTNTNNIDKIDRIELIEDNVVKIFKRNKLFWDTWDFSVLNWFLDINYNDVIVERENNWWYSILIKKWIFNINLWKNSFFYWIFSSNYNFSDNHSFINPELKLIDKKTENKLLFWNTIFVKWEYGVNKIQDEIKSLFEKYSEINFIVNSIKNTLNESEIKITYFKNLNQVDFETIYKWQNLKIKLFNWKIIDFRYNNKNYLTQKVEYMDIVQILNNIKN